jgi:hypothetical protein
MEIFHHYLYVEHVPEMREPARTRDLSPYLLRNKETLSTAALS